METQNDNESLRHIFRAYDIRGIYNEDITPINNFRIGLAFGTFLQNKKGLNPNKDYVFVAYDVRQTSSLLGQAFAAGLMTSGINIEYSGEPLQFGACMYSGVEGKAFATAFITASHLPPEWNGVKFYYGSGVGFSEEDNMEIRDIFLSNDFIRPDWKEVGQMTRKNLKHEYREYLSSKVNLKRQLKVVIDCGNGSSCLSAPEILKSIGLEVVPLFCEIDPTFPNRSSEPNEESLQQLSSKVIQENADFGVGFDGDGDRAVIVDNKGRILLADITGLILAKFLLPQFEGKNRILANVECSLALEKSLPDSAIVDRIKVGHTFLTADAQEKKDTLLGIESSGHYVFPHFYLFDDAMIVPLIVAEMLALDDEPLSTHVDQIPILHKRKIAVPVPDNIKFDAIAELLKEVQIEYPGQVNDIDGIGVSFGTESWILLRASNTGPKIRITVEADSESRVVELLNLFQNKLKDKLKDLMT
jgi:phosphomannomutase